MASVLLVVLLVLWVACIVGTGRLFKASGRSSSLGYLVGFFLHLLGVVIGLILLPKGPPKPDSGWGAPKQPGGGPFYGEPPGEW